MLSSACGALPPGGVVARVKGGSPSTLLWQKQNSMDLHRSLRCADRPREVDLSSRSGPNTLSRGCWGSTASRSHCAARTSAGGNSLPIWSSHLATRLAASDARSSSTLPPPGGRRAALPLAWAPPPAPHDPGLRRSIVARQRGDRRGRIADARAEGFAPVLPGKSAVDHPLHGLWVAVALDLHAG